MQLTCYSSGGRQSTPGDEGAVFCVISIEQVSTGHQSNQAVPVGTGFAISNKHVLTARHCCADAGEEVRLRFGLVKEIALGEGIRKSAVIMLRHVESNAADDWAVFERVDGEFASSVKICTEGRLPKASASDQPTIGVKDYAVGLMSSFSTSKLTVTSKSTKLLRYEKRLPEAYEGSAEERPTFAMPLLEDAEIDASSPPPVEDVVVVDKGFVSGSCGAPYFKADGEVVAFHVMSVDDWDDKSSSRSHSSFGQGYVLCRLPSFVTWYRGLTGTTISDVADA